MPTTIFGVDTGGTFTDLVALADDGGLQVLKVPSTPDDPARAVLEGVVQAGPAPGFGVVHGTTVATNALLERRGARTALLTTSGFRDVLEIGRQDRTALYDLCPLPRPVLVSREMRFEVPERVGAEGQVITPLDLGALDRVLDDIVATGAESLAICFLFSFLRPDHEQEAGRRARARGLRVSLSCEVAPEYREYERTSTTCASAFVAPVMAAYIGELGQRLRGPGCARLSVMQSNGGSLRAEEAAVSAIKTVLSGPAGGLVSSVAVARAAGYTRLMTFDMGGTSTDVALVDREPATIRSGEVAGMPLLTPMLDIHTVGAGGGSLARLDAGGALRVGPESAGADPGPVAYGSGDRLTVTDANVFLGRLPARVRLAGSLALDADRVRARFTAFGAQMGRTPEAAAEGVLAVVNAQMARALRHISVERGRDPSDYVLVSYGGAGGLHACALAEALGMGAILVPRYPGAFSALGLALAAVRREYAVSHFAEADEAAEGAAQALLEALAARARRELTEEGIRLHDMRLAPFVEARYIGQSYALRVPYRRGILAAGRAFHRAHRSRYGHADPTQPVEIVTVGLAASGPPREPPDIPVPAGEGAPQSSVPLWHGGRWVDCPVYVRTELGLGQVIEGPAFVLQDDATTLVEAGWRATVAAQANLILTQDTREADR